MNFKKITNTKLEKIISSIFFLSLIFLLNNCSDDIVDPGDNPNDLEYVTPEDVGYSSAKLMEAKQFAEQSGFDAVMALYDGKVLFSWGSVSKNYYTHSIRKPLLSALYGINVNQGNINLDATMEDLNIDDIPPSLTNEEKQATVRDLIKSRSGIYHEAAAEALIMIQMRPPRGSHPAGTFFYYNNWDFNVAGVVFEQETGKGIFEEFKRKIANPIGMQDFRIENCNYQFELEKSMHPAYPFRMSARDMARFGALYQKNGIWNGQQIIPGNWINESTTIYSLVDSTYGIGYGYMWNVYPEGSVVSEMIGGHRIIGHTGLGGVQALMIIPDLKLVIVERTDTDGYFEDKELGMELGMMIINARN
ncbi:MAG: serine hydrolase [Ignavibacteriaceae bacterium]|jgi:CubicO group peptidase (beta-lactamase class C family)